MVAILLYPVGLFVLNAALLFQLRKPIQSGTPTKLSHSTHFLFREYEARVFWWELMVRDLPSISPAHKKPSHLPSYTVSTRASGGSGGSSWYCY